MSDKDITTTDSQDKENKISIEDLKEPLIFIDEDKTKQSNKSCLKKEKNTAKHAVKIIVPESDTQNLNEVMKERRKRRPQFKTVKEPNELKDKKLLDMKLKNDVIKEINENNENNEEIPKEIPKEKEIKKNNNYYQTQTQYQQ